MGELVKPTTMDEKRHHPDGATIAAALDHVDKTAERIKDGLKEMRAERDKNKNEELTIPTTPIGSNVERIISKGTLYQKAVIYLQNLDVTRTFKTHTLTEEQEQRIRAELYSPENFAEGSTYTKTYNAFIQYGKLLEIMLLNYRNEATQLTGLINLWEAIQASYTALISLFNAANTNNIPDEILSLVNSFNKNGYTIKNEDGKITLDDSKIKAKIHEQAQRTAHDLSKVKAFIEPLSDFIYSEGDPPLWPLLPYEIEMWMDYPDAIPEQQDPDKAKYFRFILRKRREAGEEITPEEEALAVYPDYNELEADPTTQQFAQQQLADIFYLWEIQKREKPQAKKRGRPRKSN